MRPQVPLRWGIPIFPPVTSLVQNEDGTTRFEGKPLVIRHVNLLRELGFNVSVVGREQVSFGKILTNGSYDGFLGMIERDELDMIELPAETFIRNPPGEFGPVVASYPHTVMTTLGASEKQSLDLISTAEVFDRLTYQVFLLSLIFWFIVIKCLIRKYSIWQTLALLLTQAFDSYETNTRRLLHLSAIVPLVLLEYIFLSLYSTDLAVEKPQATIDTLEDLAESTKYKPTFFTMGNLYIQFMQSEQKTYKQVWKKVEECGLDKCLIDIQVSTMNKAKFDDETRDVAQLLNLKYIPIWNKIMCNAYGSQYKELKASGIRTILSEPFAEANQAFLMNRKSSAAMRKRIIEFSYWTIESGYGGKILMDSSSFVECSYGPVCPNTLYDKDDKPGTVYPVPFTALRRMTLYALMMFSVGVAALFLERTLTKILNMRNI